MNYLLLFSVISCIIKFGSGQFGDNDEFPNTLKPTSRGPTIAPGRLAAAIHTDQKELLDAMDQLLDLLRSKLDPIQVSDNNINFGAVVVEFGSMSQQNITVHGLSHMEQPMPMTNYGQVCSQVEGVAGAYNCALSVICPNVTIESQVITTMAHFPWWTFRLPTTVNIEHMNIDFVIQINEKRDHPRLTHFELKGFKGISVRYGTRFLYLVRRMTAFMIRVFQGTIRRRLSEKLLVKINDVLYYDV